jgi:hypothetical protein
MFPFGGSGVERVIPANSNALLFAQLLWPSKQSSNTGRSGTTSSRYFLSGRALAPNSS